MACRNFYGLKLYPIFVGFVFELPTCSKPLFIVAWIRLTPTSKLKDPDF